MPNERINISINSEIAKKLRITAIEKYGNMRSMSKLIEDLATSNDKDDIEAIKKTRIEYEKAEEDSFNAMLKGNRRGKTCGMRQYRDFECEVCGTKFEAVPLNIKYCPACRSQQLKITAA
jgi:rubrerythrin